MNNIKSPTVTVFMAVYNGEKYIKEAIESVLNQSYTDFELLIVNDGSTDGTLNIIAGFVDPRIRLLHNDGNKGLTYTRNHGVREARGKYFAILDSDDIAMPKRLKLQVEFMENHPSVAICGGQAVFIDGQSNEMTGYRVPIGENISHWLVIHNAFINSTLMIKTSVMREMGGYREMAPAEDYDLSFRISFKYQVANLSEKLVAYREHGNNISRLQTEKLSNAECQIIEHIHSCLNIPLDQELIKIHHNVLKYNVEQTSINDFERLLERLRAANIEVKAYAVQPFNKFLFEAWFNILRAKKERNIVTLFFRKPFFDWSFVTFKQLRKIFKQSFFSYLSFLKK
ncbi:glycosyltransferase family 2 protein [Pedobacter sp.]|uniref:glycosyltransferase family 2 protein n=1 Tax=Pedobacter sp. TaxID=1411316 RepID=UPI0031DB48A5